jgi:hypothetical protein
MALPSNDVLPDIISRIDNLVSSYEAMISRLDTPTEQNRRIDDSLDAQPEPHLAHLVNCSSISILSASTPWDIWSMRMGLNLYWLEIQDVIKKPPTDETQANTTHRHSRRVHQAQGLILMHTDYRLHHLLENPDGTLKHPHEMWSILEKKFDRSKNVPDLFNQYLHLVHSQPMSDQQDLDQQLLDYDSKVAPHSITRDMDESLQTFFLRSKLPMSYQSPIREFMSRRQLGEIKCMDVRVRAREIDALRRTYLRNDTDDEAASHASFLGRETCGYCGRQNHNEAGCWELHPELRPRRRTRRRYQ